MAAGIGALFLYHQEKSLRITREQLDAAPGYVGQRGSFIFRADSR